MAPDVSGVRLNDWYQVFVNQASPRQSTEMSAWITARWNEYLQALAPMTNIIFR